jgi:hypothetical protein
VVLDKETTMVTRKHWIPGALGGIALLLSGALFADPPPAGATESSYLYDEGAYTEYVETTMHKLDRLYLDFCSACGVDAEKAGIAKKEFLITVRELMQHMNGRFDTLDPKKGASLSPTETLVSIHTLTMLVDILAESQLEDMTTHPYIE